MLLAGAASARAAAPAMLKGLPAFLEQGPVVQLRVDQGEPVRHRREPSPAGAARPPRHVHTLRGLATHIQKFISDPGLPGTAPARPTIRPGNHRLCEGRQCVRPRSGQVTVLCQSGIVRQRRPYPSRGRSLPLLKTISPPETAVGTVLRHRPFFILVLESRLRIDHAIFRWDHISYIIARCRPPPNLRSSCASPSPHVRPFAIRPVLPQVRRLWNGLTNICSRC